jgi:hypothetical protein
MMMDRPPAQRIISGKVVADWVAEQIGEETFSDPYYAVGRAYHDDLLAGFVVSNYCNGNVDISIAGQPKAWTPLFVHFLADWVWNGLDCRRASFVTESEKAADLIRRMGGQDEGPAINWYGEGRDGLRLAIQRADWRFR